MKTPATRKWSEENKHQTLGFYLWMYICHCFLVFSDFINMRIWFCGSESNKKMLDVNQQTCGCLWILSNKHEDATWVSVLVPMKHDKPGNPLAYHGSMIKPMRSACGSICEIPLWVRCRVWILGIKVQVQPPSTGSNGSRISMFDRPVFIAATFSPPENGFNLKITLRMNLHCTA